MTLPSEPPDMWAGSQEEGPVPTVSADDLRNVWKVFRDAQARHPGEHTAIGNRVYERICSPGADVTAVWYRASMLWMLKEMMPELLVSVTHDGELDDEVFQVAATFPMEKMRTSVVREGPPFDVEEFVRRIGA